jgi:phosphoribosyl-AMP cyclohydrolase
MMQNAYFLSLENMADGTNVPFDHVLNNLAFNEQGLIPVITQDASTHAVLMMAWMNKASLLKTLDEQRMVYWSRSRETFWRKGESSGNTQQLVSLSVDCDGDALLCQVVQTGAACHTGRANCFFLDVDYAHAKVYVRGDASV